MRFYAQLRRKTTKASHAHNASFAPAAPAPENRSPLSPTAQHETNLRASKHDQNMVFCTSCSLHFLLGLYRWHSSCSDSQACNQTIKTRVDLHGLTRFFAAGFIVGFIVGFARTPATDARPSAKPQQVKKPKKKIVLSLIMHCRLIIHRMNTKTEHHNSNI